MRKAWWINCSNLLWCYKKYANPNVHLDICPRKLFIEVVKKWKKRPAGICLFTWFLSARQAGKTTCCLLLGTSWGSNTQILIWYLYRFCTPPVLATSAICWGAADEKKQSRACRFGLSAWDWPLVTWSRSNLSLPESELHGASDLFGSAWQTMMA